MALGLNDLKDRKNKKEEGPTDGPRKPHKLALEQFLDSEQLPPAHKERSLRPWESFDDIGLQTRTVRAREAVRKARQIVDRNNELVASLKKTAEGLFTKESDQPQELNLSPRLKAAGPAIRFPGERERTNDADDIAPKEDAS